MTTTYFKAYHSFSHPNVHTTCAQTAGILRKTTLEVLKRFVNFPGVLDVLGFETQQTAFAWCERAKQTEADLPFIQDTEEQRPFFCSDFAELWNFYGTDRFDNTAYTKGDLVNTEGILPKYDFAGIRTRDPLKPGDTTKTFVAPGGYPVEFKFGAKGPDTFSKDYKPTITDPDVDIATARDV